MHITFQKHPGNSALGIAFFWCLTIETEKPLEVEDHFIPELFYDYVLIHRGTIQYHNEAGKSRTFLPTESLKTIHTRRLTFTFATPLVLFGARFSLSFAESYRTRPLKPNQFLPLNWITHPELDLTTFAAQVTHVIQTQQQPPPHPLLLPSLEESAWLTTYSARHKRRLYKDTFGLSRKEIDSVNRVHSFLEQNCDFTEQNPRIISHLDPEVFYDQAHLNHAFKKTTGFSPLEYFETPSILQDNLMAASYNAPPSPLDKL